MRLRRRTAIAALAAALAALGILVPSASAAVQRPFLETFGAAEQPEFKGPVSSVGIERASGRVLVGVEIGGATALTSTFNRFNADGTPAPFAALGTNTLDGKLGPGGKPCNEEPASCDKTPQNGLSMGAGGFQSNQIAFDPTNGNILITQNAQNLVDIFNSEGKYIGQLTQAEGAMSKPCGVAVSSTGTIYVAQNNKVSVFEPSGNPPVNGDNTENWPLTGISRPCRMALGSGPSAGSLFIASNGSAAHLILKVDTASGAAHIYSENYESLAAVDPTSGNPIAYNKSLGASLNGFAELAELDGGAEAAGEPLSRLLVEAAGISLVRDFATDAAGKVYVAYEATGLPPTNILVYGLPTVVPTVSLKPASGITGTDARLAGTVNPEGIAVSECVFEYGRTLVNGNAKWEQTVPCEGAVPPPDSSDHPVEATITGLKPNGVKYNFRLVARYANGAEYSSTGFFLSGSSAETKPATVTGLSTATLNGIAHPEGNQLSECFFRWDLASSPELKQTAPCTPAAGAIAPDNGSHPVSAELSGLEEATAYRFQLVTASSTGTKEGPILSFETFGPPRILNVRASNASPSTAKLEAQIDPRGFGASYRFEWGPTAAYGNVAPASFQAVPPGTPPVQISAEIGGLAPGATYHYRLVASGGAGTRRSADHEVQTLNACGLPDGRCLELVSPREPGFVALPGESKAGFETEFQAAEAPGLLAYEVELGLPGTTTGGEVLYMGSRGAGGWSSVQYSPGINQPGPGNGARASVLGLSPDLSCGVVASRIALTGDPVGRVSEEAGGGNLYRRGPDGAYTLISNRVPENPELVVGEIIDEFQLIGMSRDCRRVAFTTERRYSGIPIPGVGEESWLYEWEEGEGLSYVGWVPDGGGEVAVEAGPGSGGISGSTYNAVSEDGSRVFFTATSKTGSDEGKEAVFVRIDGTKTLDVSQSPLATNTGAVFQGATPDGSRVYFTANAGLTAETSSEGRDLYECHIVEGPGGEPECELTDLSVADGAGGAEAGGVFVGGVGALVGLAADGSRAYFIARGQLMAGEGNTFAENQAANTFSLYLYEAASGAVRFVGTVGGGSEELKSVTTGNFKEHTSRTSRDGRYLLFESSANNTGYESGGKPVVYLYDAEAAEGEELACVSCRQDGKAPGYPSATRLLRGVGRNRTYLSQSLVVRNGKPLVFFKSTDALALGAAQGEWNLYEWAHGQVFTIARDLPGATPPAGKGTIEFFGASADGTDLYFVDAAALNWENPEARRSVWDARIGGGFAQPTAPPPCDPTGEGSCQGPGQGPAPSAPAPGSATFNGPGNVKSKQHKKKHHKKKHKKHHKKGKGKKGKHNKGKKGKNKGKGKGKKGKGNSQRPRGADDERRAGK